MKKKKNSLFSDKRKKKLLKSQLYILVAFVYIYMHTTRLQISIRINHIHAARKENPYTQLQYKEKSLLFIQYTYRDDRTCKSAKARKRAKANHRPLHQRERERESAQVSLTSKRCNKLSRCICAQAIRDAAAAAATSNVVAAGLLPIIYAKDIANGTHLVLHSLYTCVCVCICRLSFLSLFFQTYRYTHAKHIYIYAVVKIKLCLFVLLESNPRVILFIFPDERARVVQSNKIF